MKNIRSLRLLICSSLLVGLTACNAETSAAVTSCVSLLPKNLVQKITTEHKGWKVLEVADLFEDDKVNWNHSRKDDGACPGVAAADFKGNGKTSYAIALIKKSGSPVTGDQKLLFAERAGDGSYRLSELTSVRNAPIWVVQKGPPGQYEYFYDRQKKINVKTPTIMHVRFEASAVAYYFDGKKFEQLLISD